MKITLKVDNKKLQSKYNLTGTETRLITNLCETLDLREASKLTGISKEHARTRLKQIFAKTRTRKQVELIILALATSQPDADASYSPLYCCNATNQFQPHTGGSNNLV